MKLGIGTAQFGMNYGISNVKGKCSQDTVKKILHTAEKSHIDVVDTAALYGDSEEILGNTLADRAFRIITKISDIHTLEQSFKRLRCNKIYAVLAHHADDLLGKGGERFWDELLLAKTNGLIEKMGASVYNTVQIEQLLIRYPIDIIQVPVNLLDQRLITNNTLNHLKQKGIEIHARSVFLQGLLLLNPDALPAQFLPIQPLLKQLHHECNSLGITVLQAALAFVQSLPQVDKVIVGMSSHEEFLSLINAANTKLKDTNFSQYAIFDEIILNPSYW